MPKKLLKVSGIYLAIKRYASGGLFRRSMRLDHKIAHQYLQLNRSIIGFGKLFEGLTSTKWFATASLT